MVHLPKKATVKLVNKAQLLLRYDYPESHFGPQSDAKEHAYAECGAAALTFGELKQIFGCQ